MDDLVGGPTLIAESLNYMKMTLVKILQTTGLGSRAEVTRLIRNGRVRVAGVQKREPKEQFETDSFVFGVNEERFEFMEHAYVVMHKPAGYECSTSPTHNPSVYELLDSRLRNRKVQACGRLDVDTTGLLIFTDNGKFNQKIMSPKSKLIKTYRVMLKHEVTEDFCTKLSEGVFLKDAPDVLVRPNHLEVSGEREIILTISEGKYHQVKRMVAAASNRVVGLHREKIGDLSLRDLGIGAGEYKTFKELNIL